MLFVVHFFSPGLTAVILEKELAGYRSDFQRARGTRTESINHAAKV